MRGYGRSEDLEKKFSHEAPLKSLELTVKDKIESINGSIYNGNSINDEECRTDLVQLLKCYDDILSEMEKESAMHKPFYTHFK